jgi:hypothetical protein
MSEPARIRKGLSVVIATLGEPCVEQTIQNLMSGSLVPDEILICIPDERLPKVAHLANEVVKIVLTGVKGQVKQRAVGFQKTGYEMVLQSDDDIILENDSLYKLSGYQNTLGRGNVIAPIYYLKGSLVCNHQMQSGLSGFIKNIFDCVFCAAPWGKNKMGVVTSLGLNYGVDDSFVTEELVQTQWLPGGCVLSFREDLVIEDFFPFEGKAYGEDVYHSFYRKKAGTKMWVATRVKAFIDKPQPPEYDRNAIEKAIRIRRKYLEMIGGSKTRMFFYELFSRIRSRMHS